MQEHVLSINSFNMPKVFSESDANYVLIVRLLLLEKGKFQSHRDMGVGLRSRYRFNNDTNMMDLLKNDIKEQMIKYLPSIAMTDISLTLKDHVLGIIINTSDGAYILGYNDETDKIDTAATYVLNDL